MKFSVHKTIFILVFFFSANSYAEMYKWTDEEGNVHYSEKKPSKNFEVIKPPPKVKPPEKKADEESATDAIANAEEGETVVVTTDEERQAIEEKNRKIEEKNKEIAKQNCEVSKKNLVNLQNRERVQITSDDGTVRWASDEEKQGQTAKIQGNIDKWCNYGK